MHLSLSGFSEDVQDADAALVGHAIADLQLSKFPSFGRRPSEHIGPVIVADAEVVAEVLETAEKAVTRRRT